MGKPGQYGRKFGYKKSEFGSNTNGHDVKVYGDTTSQYMEWDASANTLNVSGVLALNGTNLTASADEINRTCDVSARLITAVSAAISPTEIAMENKIIVLSRAEGTAITLPTATGNGKTFKIIIGTSITSNVTTIKATGNDVMVGHAIICNDTDNSVSGFETAADTDTITFNGSTTGGIKGDSVELIDIAYDTWWVRVITSATGVEATPFSATVI